MIEQLKTKLKAIWDAQIPPDEYEALDWDAQGEYLDSQMQGYGLLFKDWLTAFANGDVTLWFYHLEQGETAKSVEMDFNEICSLIQDANPSKDNWLDLLQDNTPLSIDFDTTVMECGARWGFETKKDGK